MSEGESSKQTDVEMLYIEALENYAVSHYMSVEAANNLFHAHQIYEQFLLQHEYLHQVADVYVMEFAEECISREDQALLLYHGTTAEFSRIQLSRSQNRRDFGRGFYTTILEKQAEEWGYRLSLQQKTSMFYVYQYQFIKDDSLKILHFDSMNRDWLEFIKENRSKGGIQHDYDVVIGPVADDRTRETIQLYLLEILTSKEALDRLSFDKVNNQVSFHTERAVRCLSYVEKQHFFRK